MKKIYYLMFTSLLSLSAACGDDIDPIERDWVTDNGEEDIPHNIVIKDESEPMLHPGGLHSAEDLARVKAKVTSGTSPWIEGWNKLFDNDHFATSSSPVSVADESTHPDVAVTPNPTAKICRQSGSCRLSLCFGLEDYRQCEICAGICQYSECVDCYLQIYQWRFQYVIGSGTVWLSVC